MTIHWTAPRTLVLLVSIPSAIVIFSSIWVVGACIAFWTTDGGEFTNAFTYGGTAMAQYPFDIYATWLRRLLGFVVPLAFVCYFPALYVLGKPDPLDLPRVLDFASPAGRARRSNRGGPRLAVRRPPLPERRRMIEVEELRKQFIVRRGRFRRERRVVDAVNGISFRVERGELLGYLGPNGAGKSTTIKMLTGILVPTDGHVRVAGLEPSRKRIELARRIGAMFGQRIQLWWDLPLLDSFELLRHIYRVPADRYAANLTRFRELLELDPFLDTPVRQLSLGQRIRGELTAAMLHGPELLFLDEPTIGLDVVAKQRVRDFLVEINREDGVTVAAHDPRSRRHRTALQPPARDRPGVTDLGRRDRRPA